MVACDICFAVVGYADQRLVKVCLATCVTQLADRYQLAMREARKEMGMASLCWDLR